jgi:hypothetical protein
MMTKYLLCTARKLMFPFTLAASLALISMPAHCEIYKWVDSNNEVQYTQMPPPQGVESVRIDTLPGAGADDPAEDETRLEESIKASEEQKQQQEKTAADAELQAEITRISRQNCITARNNLEQLSRSGQIRYRTGDGEVLRLSEEDRNQRIEEARSQIKEFCKD